mgnify:FL=1
MNPLAVSVASVEILKIVGFKYFQRGTKMGRTFNVGTNPMDADHKVYKRKSHTINTGVTVLVGCNGSGKSSLIRLIKSNLKNNKIPYTEYNNQSDGGSNALGELAFEDKWDMVAFGAFASEGENITMNLCNYSKYLKDFVITGKSKDKYSKFARIFRDEDDEEITSKERWILLDAVDSGYSIDNVIELKEIFEFMQEDATANGLDLYIIVSANEYEMCVDQACYDVQSCKYVDVNSYEEYKELILSTRAWKDKSIERGTNNESIIL